MPDWQPDSGRFRSSANRPCRNPDEPPEAGPVSGCLACALNMRPPSPKQASLPPSRTQGAQRPAGLVPSPALSPQPEQSPIEGEKNGANVSLGSSQPEVGAAINFSSLFATAAAKPARERAKLDTEGRRPIKWSNAGLCSPLCTSERGKPLLQRPIEILCLQKLLQLFAGNDHRQLPISCCLSHNVADFIMAKT